MTKKQIIKAIIECIDYDGKIYLIGCGGSASMANHFAAELIGKVKKQRIPLPAISLSSNEAILTAISNDFGFEYVFSRQLEALCTSADLIIGISTSGKSKSIINGMKKAEEYGATIINFPRKGKDVCDVQNKQLKLMHEIVVAVEDYYAHS